MLGSLISSIGGEVGKFFGGGILSSVGRYLGTRLGDYLDKKWFHRKLSTNRFVNAKDSFHILKAQYGKPIPLTFGRMKVPGQIIWTDRITESRHATSKSKYFKKQITTVEKKTTHLKYHASFAMALCEGEIQDISRVWWGDEEIDLSNYSFRLYKGCEDQVQDPLIASKTDGMGPAYRGLAYIVFQKIPLEDFHDIIPDLSFEVIKKDIIKQDNVENIIESMIMIPGSGEYVYDTKTQEKSVTSPYGTKLKTEKINSHNHYGIANSLYSLNQLQMTCKNIKWISPVSCWFGTSTNIKDCILKPGVETNDANLEFSEIWNVGKYDRSNAHLISRDEYQNPNYGGSVNDASVIRYLEEIKQRNIKIMFYPMFFMDVPQKPWRGRLTGDADDVQNFFRKEHGYNDFIIHHAKLVKDHVDAFIIGSELIGLTKIKNENRFPAVEELTHLAALVKAIVGPDVKVSYAADWSEYHHAEGGWYNLDELWASKDIDFIGIDAYFPVTNSYSSNITKEEIAKGWSSGEGYDYYIDENGEKQDLPPAYAWKNLKYWWKNNHVNPDNKTTKWKPKSKPIWFTEFGFPSIDKSPNKPNVFFDPKCVEGGSPTYSNNEMDYHIQRDTIKAFIEYWKTQEYIEQMFLWTWDARPYPAYPHSDIWSDNNLWEKGHWVNNKFGASSVASIILELSNKCGIDTSNINTESVDIPVEGFLISNQITALNAINILRSSYFFDIDSSNKNHINFVKRGSNNIKIIDSNYCIKLNESSFTQEIEIPKNSILNKIDLYFIDKNNEYNACYNHVNNETGYDNPLQVSLPIALTNSEAYNIGNIILKNASSENKIIKFALPYSKIKIKPTDFLLFKHHNINYYLRVIETTTQNNIVSITAVIDYKNNYIQNIKALTPKDKKKSTPKNKFLFAAIELPFEANDVSGPYIAVFQNSGTDAPLYVKDDSGEKWDYITDVKSSNSIFQIVKLVINKDADTISQDSISKIFIKSNTRLDDKSVEEQYAMLGKELISFKKTKRVKRTLYEISELSRGLMGTNNHVNNHTIDENFIIIDSNINNLPVSDQLHGKNIYLKCQNHISPLKLLIKNKQNTYTRITNKAIIDGNLQLKWVVCSKNNLNWEHSVVEDNDFKFKITLKTTNQALDYFTADNQFSIDLSKIDISGGYEINIITIHEDN